jgi:hypothetical protein
VDQKIFGGAAVLHAAAEVDLKAANAGDALDARELAFAFLQRTVRPVALARDFFKVLPQPFRCCRLGESAGVGRTHLRLP